MKRLCVYLVILMLTGCGLTAQAPTNDSLSVVESPFFQPTIWYYTEDNIRVIKDPTLIENLLHIKLSSQYRWFLIDKEVEDTVGESKTYFFMENYYLYKPAKRYELDTEPWYLIAVPSTYDGIVYAHVADEFYNLKEK